MAHDSGRPGAVSRRVLFGASAALGAGLLPGAARAQGFPTQPVRVIVPFAAGGGVDIVARLLMEPMRERLGQPIIVENRAGAGGQIGANAVVRATPDGHTILLSSAGEVALAPSLYGDRLPYNPATGLAPITLVVAIPNVLVVGADVPARNMGELLALARARPGELTYATAGVGNLQHLNGELFNRVARADTRHVPYRGTGPALQDVLAGRVTMTYAGLPALLPLIREGRLRALGVTSRTRMEAIPDVPAIAEHPELTAYELTNWFAAFAPAGTPEAALDRLHAAITASLGIPDVARQLNAQGAIPSPMPRAEFARFVAAETEKLTRIVRDANIRLES